MKLTMRAALIGAALVSCGLLAAPTAALAAPPSAPPGVDQRVVPAAERAAVRDYWTADRMRAAVPADRLLDDNAASSGTVETGVPITYGAGGASADPHAGGKTTSTKGKPSSSSAVRETPVSHIGKVFFTLDGVDYVCSGNVVSAANKSVVATAGHCLNEGPGDFATRWTFVPGYENGAAPYGQWTATELTAPTQWTQQGDITYDTGFATVGTLGGQTIEAAVGAAPVAFNQARGLTYKAYGYPAASPFDGQTLWSCQGTAVDDPYGQTQSQGIPCNMTGGSSGGPWFLGNGAQNSVNSFGYRGVRNTMFGPYYGSVAQSAYVSAAN